MTIQETYEALQKDFLHVYVTLKGKEATSDKGVVLFQQELLNKKYGTGKAQILLDGRLIGSFNTFHGCPTFKEQPGYLQTLKGLM